MYVLCVFVLFCPDMSGQYSFIQLIQTSSAPSATVSGPLHSHLHTNGTLKHPIVLLFNTLVTGNESFSSETASQPGSSQTPAKQPQATRNHRHVVQPWSHAPLPISAPLRVLATAACIQHARKACPHARARPLGRRTPAGPSAAAAALRRLVSPRPGTSCSCRCACMHSCPHALACTHARPHERPHATHARMHATHPRTQRTPARPHERTNARTHAHVRTYTCTDAAGTYE